MKFYKWLIEPFMFYMGGGGGGDGGAQARADADEAAKKKAREAINRIFGIGTDEPAPVAPVRSSFVINTTPTDWVGKSMGWPAPAQTGGTVVDEAAYTNALNDYNNKLKTYKTTSQTKTARDLAYKDAGDAVYNFNTDQLNKDAALEGRNLNFQLARQGLVAGSEDINQHQRFGELFDKGRLAARNLADQTEAQARAADEQSRLNLINSINAGTDSATAISGANTALQNNLNTVKAENLGNTIGNVFNDATLITKAAQLAQPQTGLTPQQLLQQRQGSTAPKANNSYSGKTYSY